MTPFVIIFTPFIRLLAHSLAASVGFSGIAMIAVLPIEVLKMVSARLTHDEARVLETVETCVLYFDAALFLFVILIYSLYFAIEQGRAFIKIFKSEKSNSVETDKAAAAVASLAPNTTQTSTPSSI